MPATTLAPAPAPPVAPPSSTCLGCDYPIPAGRVWCSWLCRNWDDRHDDGYELEAEGDV